MIAVDTNILVYAHRPETPFHDAAYATLASLAADGRRFGFPMQCLVEFVGVARHPKIWKQPSSPAEVRDQIEAWLEPPRSQVLTEEESMLPDLLDVVDSAQLSGGAVHDARIFACCKLHGVTELWSADRDFSRLRGLAIRNPLLNR